MNNTFGPLFPPEEAGPTGPTGPGGPSGGPTGPTGPVSTTPGPTGPTGPTLPFTIQSGRATGAGGNGNVNVTLPIAYANTNYNAFVTMEDTVPAEMAANVTASNAFTIYWQGGGGGSHTLAWLTIG